eukprot:2377792-Prymnesium_polylepis.1
MNLYGSTEKPLSVMDAEGFDQLEWVLANRSSVALAQAGHVEVRMLLDLKAKNLMEKQSGSSANSKRPD